MADLIIDDRCNSPRWHLLGPVLGHLGLAVEELVQITSDF